VIYIGGKPFVLRDADTPKQNIRRYSGISADRLEQMECRLKDDLIAEAQHTHGLVLVHDELGASFVVVVLFCCLLFFT
jgi:hypothetical protein